MQEKKGKKIVPKKSAPTSNPGEYQRTKEEFEKTYGKVEGTKRFNEWKGVTNQIFSGKYKGHGGKENEVDENTPLRKGPKYFRPSTYVLKWDKEIVIRDCNQLASINNFRDKVDFVYERSGPEGLFSIIEEEHGGKIYKYGVDPKSISDAEYIAYHYVDQERIRISEEKQYELMIKFASIDADTRLYNVPGGLERKLDLIDEQLAEIKHKAETGKDKAHPEHEKYILFSGGYYSQRSLKRYDFSFIFPIGVVHSLNKLTPEMKEQFKPLAFDKIADGAASYLFEVYLNGQKKKLTTPSAPKEPKPTKAESDRTQKEDAALPENPLKFKEQYDVVLFFKYSGIYDAVLANIPKHSKRAAATTIAKLAGIPQKGESLRPLFSSVEVTKGPEFNEKLYNIESINRVIDLLEDFGFMASKLRIIRDRMID